MEAKELRIGNLVTGLYEPIAIIYTIHKDDKWGGGYYVVTEKNKTAVEVLIEIPLTKEWLLKFGFEDYGEVIVNDHERYQRFVLYNAIDGTSNFEVHIIKSNYGNMPHTEIVYSIDNDERQIIHSTEFVHNLQNSFYLSSGNELKLKE